MLNSPTSNHTKAKLSNTIYKPLTCVDKVFLILLFRVFILPSIRKIYIVVLVHTFIMKKPKIAISLDKSLLDMVDSNEYGYCETCGVEIGIRRLEARPTATQCIDCKSLDEIKEKQTKGK